MLECQKAMAPVGKSGKNEYDHYPYSSLADFLQVITPAALANGLLIETEIQDWEYSTSTSTKMPNCARVTVVTRVTHAESGERIEHRSHGESYDRGDKAIFKSFTGARKYGLQGLFNLHSSDDPEKDSAPDHAGPPISNTKKRRRPAQDVTKGSIEKWQARIDDAATPEAAMTLIKNMAGYQPLTDDAKLCQQAFDYLADKVRKANWSEEETSVVKQLLQSKFAAIDLANQSKEVFGGDSESVDQ
jgi:hypothetical protein